ncbi:type II secretion system protein GspC [Pseudidiomarina taiwanensis]|nr:type II secretion system protein GspC [Pseudidiomarina taiwanensis]
MSKLNLAVLGSRALWAVTAIFAALAVWLLAQLTWQVLTPTPEPVAGPLAAASVNRSTPLNLAGVTRLNLFGAAQQRSGSVTSAPKTTLNVRLLGVSASSDPARSAAIIEQRGSQQVYIIGEQLPGSRVELVEIFADRVILDNNGRLETLELEGIGELSDGLRLSTSPTAASAQTNEGQPPRATSADRPQIQRQRLSASQVQRVRSLDAEGVLRYIKIQPVAESGGLRGYRLSPGSDPALFEAAGFESGDIAVAVNGANLSDISTAMQMQEDLKTMNEVTITVVRGDDYIDLKLQVPASE